MTLTDMQVLIPRQWLRFDNNSRSCTGWTENDIQHLGESDFTTLCGALDLLSCGSIGSFFCFVMAGTKTQGFSFKRHLLLDFIEVNDDVSAPFTSPSLRQK